MNESFKIGSLLGVEVRVHVLFLYMAAMMVFWGAMAGNPLGLAAALFVLFSLVLLHELGHCVVARHFGIRVIDIVLWPLGGMARMSDIPEDPKIEGLVAIAGPVVNMVLAALGMGLLALSGHLETLWPPFAPGLEGLPGVLALFTWMNVMLGVFNLVPAFPMDGGRILRAWLGRRRSWLEATEIAVQVGRVVAWAMILAVFFPGARKVVPCTLPVIGIFVLWAGARELWATRARHGAAFRTAGGSGPGGAVTLNDLFRMAQQQRRDRFGSDVPPPEPTKGPPGPAPGDTHGPVIDVQGGPVSSSGYSDEEIRRLERDAGRLRRPEQD